MKARTLTHTAPVSTMEEQLYLAKRLQKIIQCATVSKKEGHDDAEFARLRIVMSELFPLVHKNSEKITFSDDCWLFKITGKNESHSIMLMSHHDVVPVSGVWKYPGFSGEIAEGRVWGRGCVDTKTPLFAEFEAIEQLLKSGFEFPCNVYLASSHNEEYTGDGMPKVREYFEENNIHPDFIIDEGGAVIEAPLAGMHCKCAMLAVHEKGRHVIDLLAKKELEHTGLLSSHDTPPLQMARFIMEIEKQQPFIRKFSPPVIAMFRELSPYMSFPMNFIFSNVKFFQPILKVLIPKLNQQAGSMLGTTYNFTELETDKLTGDCRAKMFLRCIDDKDLEVELDLIGKIAEKYGIQMKNAEKGNEFHKAANMESNGYKYVKSCVEQSFPYAACAPFILPAGSDARQFSDLCDAVIRFAPIDIDNQQFKSVHGIDENISLSALPRAVQFYKTVLENYHV
ncbi:MAG: M20/M25/M40 family metallo-hydrolase [Oscillospiraceae bacterium]